jgi:uncharacterized membrane protein
MKLYKSEIVVLILVLVSIGVGWYAYPHLPTLVVSHWNTSGKPSGYMSRFWGTFLFPVIIFVLWLLFLVFPRIDPKKENIRKFRQHFDVFILVFFAFLFYTYALTLAWNLGYQFDFVRFLVPGIVILFYGIGVLVAHAEPNWSIGIRTPWTLSSETVWRKTHELGGKLFRAAAVVGLLGMVVPRYAFWFVLVPILGVALWTVGYSYFEFRQESLQK